MPIDWNKVIEQSLSQAPLIIGATAAAVYKLRKIEKRQDVQLRNQKRIESKVNGNHKQAMAAIKAAGKYEGFIEGKQEAHNDLEHAVKTVKTVAKRAPKRSTDK